MPEYLAPGVYVEEVDTGSKPIEGVSTSTAGVVGMTERGPVDVPTLVTSIGDYYRKFGGRLDFEEFTSDQRCHAYLPYALEGFFKNLGKRAYVTRVVPDNSGNAVRSLYDRGQAGGAETVLLAGASENTGTAANLPLLLVADASAIAQNDVIRIGDGSRAEYRSVVSAPTAFAAPNNEAILPLDLPAYQEYVQGALVQTADMDDDDRETDGGGGATDIGLNSVDGLTVGLDVTINGETVTIISVDTGASQITVAPSLTLPLPAGALPVTAAIIADKSLNGHVHAGAVVIAVDNRLGWNAGDVIRIGVAPDEEYATIQEVLGDRSVAPDSGSILLTAPLRQEHADAVTVRRQHAPVLSPALPVPLLMFNTAENAEELYVENGAAYLSDQVIGITLPSGAIHYHRLNANAVPLSSMAELELESVLNNNHDIGQPVVERNELLNVVALDPGGWGNRLRISIDDEERGLASSASVNMSLNIATPNQLHLDTLTGVESGTLLELFDPATGDAVGGLLKVSSVDRTANNLVTLDGNMIDGDHIAAEAALDPDARLGARSREFSLTTRLLRRPDPAVPSRDDAVIDSETFVQLSMDPRHGRYVERIIGTTWDVVNDEDDNGVPLRRSDRRSEGESAYIRISDRAANTVEERSVRLGPEGLVDILPSGMEQPARHPLRGGDDGLATIANDVLADAMYEGVAAVDPEDRTGLFSLENIEQISLVAIPGQITSTLQQALIDHCEALRYRFAVLDGPAPSNDTLFDVQTQRQQFDSKYAALYHPWLSISDPLPDNLANIQQVALPPSGHMLGVYARTDVERGVHKAPANETVRGIIGLARTLNKSEHDILNPYPVNINVIRDFRRDNRGIRVWGARCITSDPDYKYVNVRRLMIFLEHSIDRGLQWVVFEPNAEPLWARVRRSIANFLTVVWRNGALEGTSVEEAFFVKCDRETMTQTDIDNGRLICQIGIAPVKPAEFVIIRIGLWTAHADEK